MLKLKHTHQLPHFDFSFPHPLELAPVSADDDDLTRDIELDPVTHDNNWTLDERPDTNELESFWTQVESDLRQDPEWVDFGNENA